MDNVGASKSTDQISKKNRSCCRSSLIGKWRRFVPFWENDRQLKVCNGYRSTMVRELKNQCRYDETASWGSLRPKNFDGFRVGWLFSGTIRNDWWIILHPLGSQASRYVHGLFVQFSIFLADFQWSMSGLNSGLGIVLTQLRVVESTMDIRCERILYKKRRWWSSEFGIRWPIAMLLVAVLVTRGCMVVYHVWPIERSSSMLGRLSGPMRGNSTFRNH